MKMRKTLPILFLALFGFMGIAFASEGVKWGYSGNLAPEHWGSLDPAFEMCAKGRNQAPIDLHGFIEAELPPLFFANSGKLRDLVNNGHTIKVNCMEGSSITVDGKTFNLLQFHFHTPSENLIDGRSLPMEAHFVHADRDGNLAVVALMFEKGEENPMIKKLWEKLPENIGETNTLDPVFAPYDLLPKNRDYYRFNGSLTTPPCTEGVRWFVIKGYATVSPEQVAKFAHLMHHPNNRPVQPVYARPILK